MSAHTQDVPPPDNLKISFEQRRTLARQLDEVSHAYNAGDYLRAAKHAKVVVSFFLAYKILEPQ